jgi:hypothetical protein
MNQITTRPLARLAWILHLDRQQQLIDPTTQYQAALVLQHGTAPRHFQRAYELAESAAQAQVVGAESLAHAAYDRWMLSLNQPQKYNTQWVVRQAK